MAAGAGWAFGAGWVAVRLKTEEWVAAGETTGLGGDETAGVEKSKRSFMPELWTGGDVGSAGAAPKAPKAPKSLAELVVRELAYGEGFGAGFASKKLPLLMVGGGEDRGGDRWD